MLTCLAHTDQADLIRTLEADITVAEVEEATSKTRTFAQEKIRRCLEDNDIDMICGPGDCVICIVASIAGFPAAMVPMSFLKGETGMGQPQGLMILSHGEAEGKMHEFMNLWQDIAGPWQVPARFLHEQL